MCQSPRPNLAGQSPSPCGVAVWPFLIGTKADCQNFFFMFLFVYSLNKYSWSVYHMPGTVLGWRNNCEPKGHDLCFLEAYILVPTKSWKQAKLEGSKVQS